MEKTKLMYGIHCSHNCMLVGFTSYLCKPTCLSLLKWIFQFSITVGCFLYNFMW